MAQFKKSHAALAVAMLAGLAGAETAQAEKIGSIGLEIRGRVQLACYLNMSGSFFVPSSVAQSTPIGTVSEFCNSGSGYQIIASYDGPAFAGAALQLGAKRVQLDATGTAVLLDSSLPGIASRQLSFDPSAPGQSGNISLSISAKI